MARTVDFVRRLETACRGEVDPKRLRQRVLEVLAGSIPYNGYLFALTDPTTRIATSPLADIPGLRWSELPTLIRHRYCEPVNRWDTLLDSGVAAQSTTRARNTREGSSWATLLGTLGVTDTLMAPLGDRYGCWGFVELWRTSTVFTAADIDRLADASDIVTTALRKAVASSFTEAPLADAATGPAAVVLDDDLRVATQTAAAGHALLALNPPDDPMPPVPAAAYNVGAALLAREGTATDEVSPAVAARLRLGGSSWVTARASRLGVGQLAVTIETCAPAERVDIFARAHGLSGSESEVLALLTAGMDNRQIAARRSVSEHTVHDQVSAVLAKTGTATRQILLARALGATRLFPNRSSAGG